MNREIVVLYGNTHVRFLNTFIVQLVQSILKEQKIKQSSIAIRFVDNVEIKKLNKKYRKKNTATDVLAFCGESSGFGDIFINVEHIQKQVKIGKISFKAEVVMLLIHGLLHLLGYEHVRKNDALEMWKLQNYYVNKYKGSEIPFSDFG